MFSFWRNQWEQIRGNAKYDILLRLLGFLGAVGMLTGAWDSIRWWLIQPVDLQDLLLVWVVSSLLLMFVWLANAKLIPLAPRLEYVDQNPNGTGYKKPGGDIAFVAPFKNQSRWWHSALPGSRKVIAHIDFFAPGGRQVEACYSGMWINERSFEVTFSAGQTKELILALSEQKRPGEYVVPEVGTSLPKNPRDILQAHMKGAMLTLRPLGNGTIPPLLPLVQISSSGYNQTVRYALFLEREEPGIQRVQKREWRALEKNLTLGSSTQI